MTAKMVPVEQFKIALKFLRDVLLSQGFQPDSTAISRVDILLSLLDAAPAAASAQEAVVVTQEMIKVGGDLFMERAGNTSTTEWDDVCDIYKAMRALEPPAAPASAPVPEEAQKWLHFPSLMSVACVSDPKEWQRYVKAEDYDHLRASLGAAMGERDAQNARADSFATALLQAAQAAGYSVDRTNPPQTINEYLKSLLQRAESALSAQAAAEAEVGRLEELQRMQQVAICVAASANTHQSMKEQSIDQSNPYWTPAYGDVIIAIKREIRERERAEASEHNFAIECDLRKAAEQRAVGMEAVSQWAESAVRFMCLPYDMQTFDRQMKLKEDYYKLYPVNNASDEGKT